MSGYNPFLELPEQLCYVQCGFCNTILLVSVPCNSLMKMVTVRCGHCEGLLSVNMCKASFVPLQFLASLEDADQQRKQEACDSVPQNPSTQGCLNSRIDLGIAERQQLKDEEAEEGGEVEVKEDDDDEEEDDTESDEENTSHGTVNKPPEKRQRAPSAYNRFIREEIQRIKARNPKISHKEAFSAAAKNPVGTFPSNSAERDQWGELQVGNGQDNKRGSYFKSGLEHELKKCEQPNPSYTTKTWQVKPSAPRFGEKSTSMVSIY